MSEQKQIRTAVYLRVSTEEQVEKYGIELQQAAVEGIIKSRGQLDDGKPAMVLAGKQYIYKDEGISGTTQVDDRPAFLQMKEDIEDAPEGTKPFDVVAVYRIDRFARKLKILLEVIDYFEKHDIQFISANESIDTSTPFGKAMLGIIGVIAELEIETTKARTRDGRIQARNRGVFMGPNAPYGYKKNKDKQLEILEVEAEVVRQIFELFVTEKKSTLQIADYLKDQEILSPLPSAIAHGKRRGESTKTNDQCFWRDSTVRDIVKDEIYLGKYYYNKFKNNKRVDRSKWTLSHFKYEPIIDTATFELAQKRIKEETALRNSRKTSDNHIYLLSGLLKCGACRNFESDREPLTWGGTSKKLDKNGKSFYYQCGGKNTKKYSNPCRTIPFPAKEIELFVTNFIKSLLSDPQIVYKHIYSLESTKQRTKQLKAQQASVIQRLNRLPVRRQAVKHQHEHGYISNSALEEKTAKIDKLDTNLQEELATIEKKLANYAISDMYVRVLEKFSVKYESFLNETMTDRQEIFDLIHLIIDKINVYSRKTNDKDVIAGRKTKNQMIPYQVRIDLRLPQDMMLQLAKSGKFESKNVDL